MSDVFNSRGQLNYRHLLLKWCGSRCFRCDEQRPYEELNFHHSDGDKENNDPRNFAIVCNSCHRETHGHAGGWDTIEEDINQNVRQVLLKNLQESGS